MSNEIKRNLLRMDLQTFAESPESPENPELDTPDEPETTSTVEEPENKPDDMKFTPEQQAKVDQIIADRLAREKKKRDDAVKAAEAEAERKRLEEEGQYKELANKLQKQLDEQKADALKSKKETLLSKAGYKEEQIEVFASLVVGETDEELQASLDRLKAVSPPAKTYADPSTGNGKKVGVEKTDLHEQGKSAYQRLKAMGKIRGRK